MKIHRLLIGILFLLAVNPRIVTAHTSTLFTEKCSVCHTIGGGKLTGPDLLPVQKWSLSKISENVRRMAEYAGELSDKEIEDLSRFLKDPHGTKGLAKEKKGEQEMEKGTEHPSSPELSERKRRSGFRSL